MSDQAEQPRIYGQADEEDGQSAPEEGLRGEQGAPEALRDDLSHDVHTNVGGKLTLQEQSGVAFAEASGKVDGKDVP